MIRRPSNCVGVIESSMTLKTVDDAHVLLSYYGHNPELGKMLVNYYTQRLISRTKDGLARNIRNLNRARVPESGGPPRFRSHGMTVRFLRPISPVPPNLNRPFLKGNCASRNIALFFGLIGSFPRR